MLEVNVQRPCEGMVDVYAELRGGTRFIGRIPQSELIPVGDVRALMRVIVLEDGPALGDFALVEPCYDARWRLEPDCHELLVYRNDLAPDFPPGMIPEQRRRQLASR